MIKNSPKNHQPPEILKFWKAKLLVLVLCALSFFAGWASKQEHMNKQCYETGGHIVIINSFAVCKLS